MPNVPKAILSGIVLHALLLGSLSAQQTPYVGFYRNNWALVNPAANDPWSCVDLSNWDHATMLTASYRKQGLRSEIEDAPEFYSFTFEHTPEVIKESGDARKIGLMPFKWGFSGFKDKAGAISTLGVYGFFSYNWPMGEGTFHVGAGVGGIQYGLDRALLKNYDPDDPVIQEAGKSVEFDASFGILYRDASNYFGLSMPQTLTDVYTKRRRTHVYCTAGKLFDLSEEGAKGPQLEPSTMLRWTPGLTYTALRANFPLSADLNCRLHIPVGNQKLWTGAGMGTALNLNMEFGVEFLKKKKVEGHNYDSGDLNQFRIGLDGGIPLSNRRRPLGATFEVTLAYAWN